MREIKNLTFQVDYSKRNSRMFVLIKNRETIKSRKMTISRLNKDFLILIRNFREKRHRIVGAGTLQKMLGDEKFLEVGNKVYNYKTHCIKIDIKGSYNIRFYAK